MADDLRRWLLGMPIEARRPSIASRAVKFARRRKLAVGAAACVTVLAVSSVVLYANSSRWRSQALEVKSRAELQEVELALVVSENDLREGKFEKGLAYVEAALKRFDNVPRLHTGRALFMERLGRRTEAIEYLEGIAQRMPGVAHTHKILSTLYNNAEDFDNSARHAKLCEACLTAKNSKGLHSIRARVERDPAARLELLNQAIEENPEDIASIMDRSYTLGELRRYDEMLLDSQRAAAMRPKWALCQGYLGRALLKNNRNPEAIAAFARAIELESNDALWWAGRAIAFNNARQFESALFDANRAIELDPANAQAYSLRGKVRSRTGEPGEGLLDCAKAIELEPGNEENYINRIGIYSQIGDWNKLLLDADRVTELVPNDPRGPRWRGLASFQQSSYETAIAAFDRVLKLEPHDFEAAHNRGYCYLRLRRLNEAAADFTLCLTINSSFSPAFESRSRVYWQLGKHGEALADLTRAIEIGVDKFDTTRVGAQPNRRTHVVEAYARRAKMNLTLGLFDAAIEDYTRVLELVPNDDAAHLSRGMAYELAGRAELALEDYSEVASGKGDNADYGQIWLFLTRRQLLGQAGAHQPVFSDRPDARPPARWTGVIARFLQDEISKGDFLRAAANNDEKAESLYYTGRKELLSGNIEEARSAFQECIALDREGILEVDFARAFLRKGQNR